MLHLKPDQLRASILADEPTDAQRDAIFSNKAEYLLRACPGSGKTWTTCRRFLWRVANWNYVTGGLAMLSFTKTAVKEFKTATSKVGRAALDEPHFVGTLDSFVERFVLGPFGHLITDAKKRPKLFTGPRPGDLNNKTLTVKIEVSGGRWMPVPAWSMYPRIIDNKFAITARPHHQEVTINKEAGTAAINALIRRGEYAHQHRAFWACHLMRKFPRIGKIMARRFPEVIVDEAQDTGIWLILFLKHLKTAGVKVTLVGDPDQCIYEFGQASFGTLASLKTEWGLEELPLNKSFRCNDVIAAAVRQISGNQKFEGRGPARSGFDGAYLFPDSTEGFAAAIESFRKRSAEAGLKTTDCAILCRGHEQIAKIQGVVRYKELKGRTKRMAEAAYLRDGLSDFPGAVKEVTDILRDLCVEDPIWSTIDDQPNSEVAVKVTTEIWKYVRSENGLPSIHEGGTAFIAKLRSATGNLLNTIGIAEVPNLATQFKKTGLDDADLLLPLFGVEEVLPEFRFDTIHKAKGETIGGVLVIGSKGFFDDLVKDVTAGAESEDKRLGYVAMTRAMHLLYIAVPTAHFATYGNFWRDRGFKILG